MDRLKGEKRKLAKYIARLQIKLDPLISGEGRFFRAAPTVPG